MYKLLFNFAIFAKDMGTPLFKTFLVWTLTMAALTEDEKYAGLALGTPLAYGSYMAVVKYVAEYALKNIKF